MRDAKLRVAVLGAGSWADHAHIPGWLRDPRADVVVLADVVPERAESLRAKFGIPESTADWQAAVARSDVDVVDIVTPSRTHTELALAALEVGKHVLCEKPVAYDFRETLAADALAKAKGLKTKLGFTFRYSPGVQYAKSLIDGGFVGRPFFFNGYEQNSQWLDPGEPLRQVDPDADPSRIQTSSRFHRNVDRAFPRVRRLCRQHALSVRGRAAPRSLRDRRGRQHRRPDSAPVATPTLRLFSGPFTRYGCVA